MEASDRVVISFQVIRHWPMRRTDSNVFSRLSTRAIFAHNFRRFRLMPTLHDKWPQNAFVITYFKDKWTCLVSSYAKWGATVADSGWDNKKQKTRKSSLRLFQLYISLERCHRRQRPRRTRLPSHKSIPFWECSFLRQRLVCRCICDNKNQFGPVEMIWMTPPKRFIHISSGRACKARNEGHGKFLIGKSNCASSEIY